MFEKIKEFLDKREQAKLDERNKQKDNSKREDSVVHNFIPYACYYDKNTILTKNGELLQSIRVKGLSYDTSGGDDSLRDSLVQHVFKRVPSNKFSFYLHTIRRQSNFDDSPSFKESFAKETHDNWVDSNQWDNGYVNDLYVTIIHSGLSVNVNTLNFIKYFSYSMLESAHEEELSASFKELSSFVNDIIKRLSAYHPLLLGFEKDARGGYTSSLLNFFCKIVHLDNVNLPVIESDLSRQIGEYKIAFGNNALEVKKNNRKLFASVLSMKEYSPISKIGINKLLSLPQQMVITQTVNFVDAKEAIKKAEYQSYVFSEVAKAQEMSIVTGLDDVVAKMSDNQNSTSFCKTQLTIMALSDDLTRLDSEVDTIYKTMSVLGVPVVKEDLRMEGAFWSQLPANFVHIQRQFYLHYSLIGGFSVLGGFPFGTLRGFWGGYVCLFKTIFGTPYFFNFHVQNNGHTIIIGDDEDQRNLLNNFLISESLKFNPKVLYIDTNKSSKVFVALMGGKYLDFSLDKKNQNVLLNPLLLEDRPENRDFLAHWFLLLADQYLSVDGVNKYMGAIQAAINKLYELPLEKRQLNNIKEFFVESSFDQINQEFIELLAPWCNGGGILDSVFNNGRDDLLDSMQSNDFCAIDLTDVVEVPMLTQLPILLYILHCFRLYCTGDRPSIFALSKGNHLLQSMYFVKNLEFILDDLMLNNSVFITSCSFYSEEVNWNEKIAAIFNKKIANKFFMSSYPSSYNNIKEIFNLSNEDFVYVQSFSAGDNRFLLRHNNLSILSSVSFANQYFANFALLASGYKFEKQFNELHSKYGNDLNRLLPPLKEYIRQHG